MHLLPIKITVVLKLNKILILLIIRVLKTQTSKKVHQNKDYDQYIKQYLLGNVPLWSPSYFIATTGGATLEKVKEYVESQPTDDHKRKYQKTGRYRKQRKK